MNRQQLIAIQLIMEHQLEQEKNSRKKAKEQERDLDEYYHMGREDAFELITGKLNLYFETNPE